MDGPNMNWSILIKLEHELVIKSSEKNVTKPPGRFEIGLCALYVIHGAFRIGHDQVNWKVQQALMSGFWLFKESTPRKVVFKKITEFCWSEKKNNEE